MHATKTSAAPRAPLIDQLRGFGIYLVVVGHCIEMAFGGYASASGMYWRKGIYAFHMAFFFVLSGYLACGSIDRYSIDRFLSRKLVTIFVPYLAWSAVAVAQYVLLQMLSGQRLLSAFVDGVYVCLIQTPSMWYLWALLWMSLLLYMDVKLAGRIGPISHLLAWAVLILLPKGKLGISYMEIYYPFFLAGYYLKAKKDSAIVRGLHRPAFLYGASIAFLALVALGYWLDLRPLHGIWPLSEVRDDRMALGYLYAYACGATGCVACYVLVRACLARVRPVGRALQALGLYSLDIYALHPAFLRFCLFVPVFVLERPLLLSALYAPVYSMLVCALIIALSYLLRKIPLYSQLFLGARMPASRVSS